MSSPAKRTKAAGSGFSPKDVVFETRLFIDNEFVPSVSGKKMTVVNPADESVLTEVYEADERDVDLAVQAAKRAFDEKSAWRTMPASKRRDLILKLADLIERDREELAVMETLDNGKPLAADGTTYGSSVDIHLVIQCFRYYAGWADKIMGTTLPVDADNLVYTLREPAGVCGLIIAWNFPCLLLSWKLAPALACGCTMVLKSSEKTPLSALKIAHLIKEAGFPPGVVNVISGYGPTAGTPLVKHPDVHKISFTGSTAVGKKIEEMAAQHVKRVTLELGGKSPLIVFDDADLEEAVQTALTANLLNGGQVCCAGSRLFVQEGIYDKFVARAVELVRAHKVGQPLEQGTKHGPLVDDIQFKRVMSYIEVGKKEGAHVATGGVRVGDKGFFVAPTVFTGVKDDMTIAREEIFGPVMSILKFKTVDEVVERANNSPYGLAGGIMSRDIGKASSVAARLRTGTVWINTFNFFDAAAGFGGYKESGRGRELGPAALDNFLEQKTVVVPRTYKA